VDEAGHAILFDLWKEGYLSVEKVESALAA